VLFSFAQRSSSSNGQTRARQRRTTPSAPPTPTPPPLSPTVHPTAPVPDDQPLEYSVDGAAMEPMYDAFLEWAYGALPGDTRAHNWHHQNPVIIINPSKVRGAAGVPVAA